MGSSIRSVHRLRGEPGSIDPGMQRPRTGLLQRITKHRQVDDLVLARSHGIAGAFRGRPGQVGIEAGLQSGGDDVRRCRNGTREPPGGVGEPGARACGGTPPPKPVEPAQSRQRGRLDASAAPRPAGSCSAIASTSHGRVLGQHTQADLGGTGGTPWRAATAHRLSNGMEMGPLIGAQSGPLPGRLVPVIHRRDPRAAECPSGG